MVIDYEDNNDDDDNDNDDDNDAGWFRVRVSKNK